MPTIASVKIFPSIGIARLGNSPEWYIGPEIPFPAPRPAPPGGMYKDAQCRIKRQGARFRIFGFDAGGALVQEVTAADASIAWTVHLANTKGNNAFCPDGITIDPGARTLSEPNQSAAFNTGTFMGMEVPLGEMLTEADGRLVVLGGYGNSGSPNGIPLNGSCSSGWYDDVSDGPVNASVTLNGTTTVLQATGAWVICPPTDFAPAVDSVISLYDTMRQVAIHAGMLPAPGTPSFVQDIYPILLRALGARRVAALAFAVGEHNTISMVIPPGPGQDAQRQTIFNKLKNPSGGGGNMPLLAGAAISTTLKPFQYAHMQQWSLPNSTGFINDWPPVTPSLTPDGMTRAALEACVGAAFEPGIEATINVTTASLYSEPFRFDQAQLNPGDITKEMSRPWQADFAVCSGAASLHQAPWWPAQRPDSVFPQGSTTAVMWARDIATSTQDMVDNWYRLGFIVDPGNGNAVEVERHVVCQDCFMITDRSTVGKDEIAGILAGTPATSPAVIDAAFYVVVEGFKPSELGITTPTPTPAQLAAWAPTITFTPPIPGMTAPVSDFKPEDSSLPDAPQRFTFVYALQFTDTSGFTVQVQPVTLTATIAGVSCEGTIYLVLQPNPYMVDGAVSWLSTDLRVFQVQANQSLLGQTMGSTAADAPTYIRHIIQSFNGLPDAGHPFYSISTDEQTSKLELSQKVGGALVFNFAVAKVSYRATTLDATNVRVFFRLFSVAATGTDYDLNATYRRGGQPGTVIPLLGVQGGELVTIPCFAAPRIDSSTQDLNFQPDPLNVQTITHAGGTVQHAYFGCWLDINQPDLQFALQPSPINGPFTSGRQSIQQLIRGLHQCLVAEVAFDPDPIAPGATPASSDKLSQRNLAIVETHNPGTAVQHTFEIKPTRATLARGEMPDELLIDWGATPIGSTATIYMPSMRVSEVLALAGKMYEQHLLERVDDHTLRCKTDHVTYVPIPAGVDTSFAGLLTIHLPSTVRRGQVFKIVVRQVTSRQVDRQPPPPPILVAAEAREMSATVAATSQMRRVILGSFQITVPVVPKATLLQPALRHLSVLRYIEESIPPENRWFLVFRRYVREIADGVRELGGDPSQVVPSPAGEWKDVMRARCTRLTWTTALLLAAFVSAGGALTGSTLAIAAPVIGVLLVIVAVGWIAYCHPRDCRLLRTFIAGGGVGAAVLGVLALLSVSTPQLVPMLAATVVLLVVAGVVGGVRRCF
jgi:hypothetical protein